MNSKQQEAAASFGADICVSAGAGSGKTSVLVNRFKYAVIDLKQAPDRILALTFTEPAANHMKRQLVKEFIQAGREEDRRALETAYIGTIHGFCARLLRENPIEAAVDPYFKVLSKAESDILMTKALDAAFEAHADSAVALEMLTERGEVSVRLAALRLYAHFRATGEDENILTIRSGLDRKPLEAKISQAFLEVIEIAGKNKKITANEAAAIEGARHIPKIFSAAFLDWRNFEAFRVIERSIQKRGSETFKEWVESFRKDAGAWKLAALGELFFPFKEEFLKIMHVFMENYENEKRLMAALDFEDLTLLAWKLLKGETPAKKAVRERYRNRFCHLLVDEFQDTSPLQAKLIDLLRSKNNLFLVGDPQQSIYAFRHAEPALFGHYEALAGKKITLDENYRSRFEVLDFVNHFFAVDAHGVFKALVPGKKFLLEVKGTIEPLCAFYGPDEKLKDLDEGREDEARLLAERILSLVRSGVCVEDGTLSGRPMKWGDVAILMRSAKKAQTYERALSRLGVPFYSPKSKSFFEKTEIKDLVSLLALLDHPDDDVALAAALRSPLASVSDDGLFWLARAAKKDDSRRRSLSRALDNLSTVEGLSEKDRLRVQVFVEFLESLRSVKNSFTVSSILEKILRWSDYECFALAGPDGIQRVANGRKLVEIARSLEEKMSLDAAEFVRYAKGMAERDETEEARIATDGSDAVFLSSIHAAKGLEFPVVAIANLGGQKKPKDRGLAIASTEGGLGWSWQDPLDERKKLNDEAYEVAANRMDEKEEEEEDRILYVAVTRAREHLLLCGAAPRETVSGNKNATWMERVLNLLGREKALSSSSISGESREPSVTTVEPVMPDVAKILERLHLPQKPYDAATDLSVSDLLAQASPKPPVYLEEPETIDPEDLERSPRNEYGTIYHRVMEMMTLGSPRGFIREDFLMKILSPLTSAEKDEIRESSAAFWKSPLGTSVKKSPACHPELPFIFKTPHGILKGQIDLVYREAGQWVILDYKTNQITSLESKKTAQEYEFQLGLYAFVFRELYGEAPVRGMLYFSTLNQTHEFVYSPESLEKVRERLLACFQQAADFRLY